MIDNSIDISEFYPPHILNVARNVYDNFFGGEKALVFSVNEVEKTDIIRHICALTTAELTQRSCRPDELAKHREFIDAVKEKLKDDIAAVLLPESEIGISDSMPDEHLEGGQRIASDIYDELKAKIRTLPNQQQRQS